ncbi:MAG: hypothetical protein HYS36_05205 [Candidatus Rokubacteria bacterium]|nr:hypothetical protein [Candidatus Rokubacteria bacterium]MBI2524502.1 hypothetical protein [Candidatus Rokubacteria bacterium]
MRAWAGALVVLGVLLLAAGSAVAAPALGVRIVPPVPRQGDVAVVFVTGA